MAISIGADQLGGDLGAIDGAGDHAKAVAQGGDIKARIVENFGDLGVGEQLDQIGRLAGILGNLDHIGTAIAGRQLDHAKAVAMGVQAHGFGVDGHFTPVIIGQVGQVATVQSDSHERSRKIGSIPDATASRHWKGWAGHRAA